MTKLLKRRAVNLPAGEARRQEVLADYPGGRMGEPGEAGDHMVFLASSRAACVRVAVFPIDGGLASFGSIIKPRPRNGDAAGR